MRWSTALVVVAALGCAGVRPGDASATERPTAPDTIVFSISATSTPCPASGCVTSGTTLNAAGVVTRHQGDGQSSTSSLSAETRARWKTRLRQFAHRAQNPVRDAPALHDLAVRCRVWDGTRLVVVDDDAGCLALERELWSGR